MKKITVSIILFFYAISSFIIHAQGTPDTTIKEFFAKYRLERNSALDYIFSTNDYVPDEKVTKVKTSLTSLSKQIGNYVDYELITKKSAGKDLVLYSYLVKYDRQPLRFTMIFYRSTTVWRLYNFQFDTDVDDELEKAAVIQMLPENLEGSK